MVSRERFRDLPELGIGSPSSACRSTRPVLELAQRGDDELLDWAGLAALDATDIGDELGEAGDAIPAIQGRIWPGRPVRSGLPCASMSKGRRPVILELRPPEGIPPVHLGMTRETAGQALAELGVPKPFARGGRGPVGWAVHDGDLDLFVYCDEDGLVNAVELGRPGLPGERSDVQVMFQGLDVLGTPALDVLAALKERGIRLDEDDEYYPTAPDLLLAFSREGDDHGRVAADDLPAYFESVLVAAPGYYD
jgi:hypothetical protein